MPHYFGGAAQDRFRSGLNSRIRPNADALDSKSDFCGNQAAKAVEMRPVGAARCQQSNVNLFAASIR
jgi:hypothetical protein